MHIINFSFFNVRRNTLDFLVGLATLTKCPKSTNIIPIIIGDPKKTIKISKNLEKKGFFISPIRPPSVPPNSSRLRISITSLHTNKLIKKLFNTLKGFKNEI